MCAGLESRLVGLSVVEPDPQHCRLEILLRLKDTLDLALKLEKVVLPHRYLFDLQLDGLLDNSL